jgi:hypothetical protein
VASNEQVRIDLEAKDNASKTIDHVADAVDDLEHADPEIGITADDDASKTIGKVADAAGELDKADPEVTIGAQDHASAAIADVRADAAELGRTDTELILKARVDAAKSDLKALRDELEQTGDKADDTARQLDRVDTGGGSGLRGNAIADLTGPLGAASSAASDFAGVFDGLGDIASSTAEKLGASSATAGKVAGALGGLGVAVAVGAAAWSLWNERQEAAAKRIEETRAAYAKLQGAIAKGDIREAAKEFLDLHKEAIDAGRGIGSSTDELVNFIDGVGKTDPKLEQMADRLAELNAAADDHVHHTTEELNALAAERAELEKSIGPLVAARDAHRDNAGAYTDEEKAINDTAEALANHVHGMGTSTRAVDLERAAIERATAEQRDSERATDDASDSQEEFARRLQESEAKTHALETALESMRGQLDTEQALLTFTTNFQTAIDQVRDGTELTSQDILDLKGDLLNVAEYAKLNPVQIAALLKAVEAGDIQGVLNMTQAELDKQENAVMVRSKLDRPNPVGAGSGGGNNAGPRSVPDIGVVNMMLPAGWRGDPVRAAHSTRRRAGRLYSR